MNATLKRILCRLWALPVCFLFSYAFASLFSENNVVYFDFASKNHVFYIWFSVLLLLTLGFAYVCFFTPFIKRASEFLDLFPSNSATEIYSLVFSAAVAVAFCCLAYNGPVVDYEAHTEFAMQFDWSRLAESVREFSSPLWHTVTSLLTRVLHIPVSFSCALSTSLFCLGTYLAARGILRYYVNDAKYNLICDAVAAMLMFMQPLFVPWFNPNPIIGQGSPVVLHNPTSLAVQPFALLCAFLALRILKNHSAEPQSESRTDYFRLSFFVFLSTLAKPSFIQIFVPALGIYLAVYLISNKFREILFCVRLAACFVPAVLYTFFIMFVEFLSADMNNGNTIEFGWFDVWRASSPNIPVSILLGAGFCILYILLKNIRVKNKTEIFLMLLCWIVGILEFGILMESGDRKYHGNFSWGYCISLSLMYVFVTAELLANTLSGGYKSRKIGYAEAAAIFVMAIQFVQGFNYFTDLV